jgi:lipoate-protein ligase A
LNCSLVRRSSGGGAILHDRELTYSICVPDDNRLSSASTELYDLVHQQIIELLAERGIEASLATGCGRGVAKGCSFLCFERLTDGDVVIGRNKICGSAQRRMKHAVVQHGSLLLNQSECAPELPGVQELTGQALEISDVVAGLTERISGALGLRLSAGQLTPEEIAAAKDIERQRFAADGWTLRR